MEKIIIKLVQFIKDEKLYLIIELLNIVKSVNNKIINGSDN